MVKLIPGHPTTCHPEEKRAKCIQLRRCGARCKEGCMATIVTTDWDWKATDKASDNAIHPAVHREDLIGGNGQELSLLRHPSHPFLAEISPDPSTLFAQLCRVAEQYL